MINQATIDRAVDLIGKGYSQYDYFFSNLSSPEWILPLREKGFFSNPLSTIRRDGSEYWLRWPESRYLARIAASGPQEVLTAFQGIPKTDNPFIHADIVEAALKIPADMAAPLTRIECEWLKTQSYLGTFAEDYGALISHLAKGGEVTQALEFAQVLLDIIPDPRFVDADVNSDADADAEFGIPSSPRPKPRLRDWYEKVLGTNVPDLVAVAGIDSVRLFSNLLAKAIRLSHRDPSSLQPNDHLDFQLPNLEELDEVSRGDTRVLLAKTLLQVVEQAVSQNLNNLAKVLEILDSNNWNIFTRIALYTLTRVTESVPALCRRYVLDPKLFQNGGIESEYFNLLQGSLASMSKDERNTLFRWIQNGPPDLPAYMSDGQEEKERYVKSWKCRRYHVCREHIFGEYEVEYSRLLEEVGSEGTATFQRPPKICHTWFGPLGPCTPEELGERTDAEIIQYISTWIPKSNLMEPTIEGLARTLRTAVERDGQRFSQMAEQLIELDPTYVRALFGGLENAIKKASYITWGAVLKLAQWVVEKHGDEPDTDDYTGDRDPGWSWTRKRIASLLETGLNPCESEIPFEHRQDVWVVLETLCEDSDPTPEYEAEYGGTNMGPINLSLNVVRGRAISAAIGYALWVKRHRLAGLEEDGAAVSWVEQIPEVFSVLECHLDPKKDPSPAIRSNYGQYIPQLIWLDEGWTRANVSNIFGISRRTTLEESAWSAFMYFCQPSTKLLGVLAPVYRYAVEHLAPSPDENADGFDQGARLGQHLITYYVWGILENANIEGMLSQFFKNAEDRLRSEAIDYAGEFSNGCPEDELPKLKSRLMHLWRDRRKIIDDAPDVDKYKEEISAFGSWFVSDAFEEDWALDQLVWALQSSKKVRSAHLVVKRLSNCSDQDLPAALICLKSMMEGDEQGWEISSWRKDVKRLLRKCLDSESQDLSARAENVIHWLGARGLSEYRSLLTKADSP
ncbi:MAG: hypothetical protein KF886_07240 [Candidatus Hydrogenedentes bacterium]|nr:hypothetical protein [Candidatus Hydrogenedentota bacterium]